MSVCAPVDQLLALPVILTPLLPYSGNSLPANHSFTLSVGFPLFYIFFSSFTSSVDDKKSWVPIWRNPLLPQLTVWRSRSFTDYILSLFLTHLPSTLDPLVFSKLGN